MVLERETRKWLVVLAAGLIWVLSLLICPTARGADWWSVSYLDEDGVGWTPDSTNIIVYRPNGTQAALFWGDEVTTLGATVYAEFAPDTVGQWRYAVVTKVGAQIDTVYTPRLVVDHAAIAKLTERLWTLQLMPGGGH
jgi:hypothetical protein